MEAIAVTLVLVGAMGLFMSNIGSDIPIKQDQSIMILLAGILFYAVAKALDYLKEIRDSLQKIADKE